MVFGPDKTFRLFGEHLRRYLDELVTEMARSHPDKAEILAGDCSDEHVLAMLRIAIAGNDSDAVLDERGWDIGDAVADVYSRYETIADYLGVIDEGEEVALEYLSCGAARWLHIAVLAISRTDLRYALVDRCRYPESRDAKVVC